MPYSRQGHEVDRVEVVGDRKLTLRFWPTGQHNWMVTRLRATYGDGWDYDCEWRHHHYETAARHFEREVRKLQTQQALKAIGVDP